MKMVSEWDVIVCGAGPAGMCAAVAAARNGAKTLLIERHGFLGGTSTMCSVGPFATFFVRGSNPDGPPIQSIIGMGDEIVSRLVDAGGSPGHIPEYTPFDPEILKYVYLQMAEEAGVNLLLHSFFVDSIIEGDKIKGVIVENKSGRQPVMGKVVVDASGDGDVAACAGAPYEVGRPEDGLTQPPTLFVRVSHVNVDKFWEYAKNHGQHFSNLLLPEGTPFEHWRLKPINPMPSGMGYSTRWFMGDFMEDEVKRTKEAGELYYGREAITVFTDVFEGDFILNATRVLGGSSMLDVKKLTYAEVDARKQTMSLVKFLIKHCPGFENARIKSTGPQLGVRETRRIMGEYKLTGNDVKKERKFPDGIAIYGFPMDLHNPMGGGYIISWYEGFPKNGCAYDIPYRCLVPQKVENLLVAGRPISCDVNAYGSIRQQPCCMATGQAAGTAAALAVKRKVTPRELDVLALRRNLLEQGVKLDLFQEERKNLPQLRHR